MMQFFNTWRNRSGMQTSKGYSLLEMALAVCLLGVIAGGVLNTLTITNEVNAVKKTNDQLDKIQAALDTYIAKNGYAPCPAARTAAQGAASYGVATDCTAAATAGVTDYGSGVAQIRLGAVPTRTLDLEDSDMLDGWNNRISYSVIKQLAQNASNYTDYTNTSADSIVIRDVNNNRINSPLSEDNHILYLLVSHGKASHGAYNEEGKNLVACGNYKDSENCNNDNIFRDASYNSNSSNYFDNFIRWKSKAQQKLDSAIFPSVTQPSACSNSYTPASFTPTDLAGLRLWLDANDSKTIFSDVDCSDQSSDRVQCWKDKSGNNYKALQTGNPSVQPQVSGTSIWFKNNYFLQIEGSPSGAVFSSTATVSAMDIFIVMQSSSIGGNVLYYNNNFVRIPWSNSRLYWQFNGSGSGSNAAWGGSTGVTYIWNMARNLNGSVGTHKAWRDDSVILNSTNSVGSTKPGTADFFIGCDNSGKNCATGYINEIIIYDNMLSDDDRIKVKAYLKSKWKL